MHRRLAQALFLAAIVVMALAPGGVAISAEKVQIRAGAHAEFARIVFDWPKLPEGTARIDGSILIIRFDEAFEADYAPVRRHLFRYISDIEPGRDGKSVSMTLLQPVSLKAQTVDGVRVFDLVPAAAGQSADSTKRDVSPKPETARQIDAIKVRAGEHRAYSRLVFDWRRNVGYRVVREGETVTVRFDRPGRLQFDDIRNDPPRHFTSLNSDVDGNVTQFRVGVGEDARLRHFRSGTSVVLDVLDPPPTAQRKAEADSASAPESEATKPLAPVAVAPPPAKKPKSLLAKPGAEVSSQARVPASSDGPKMPAEPQIPVQVTEAAPVPSDPAPAVPLVQNAGDGKVTVTLATRDGGVDLSFTWPEPVAAAVFGRASYLWLVFDEPAQLDLRGVAADTGIAYADQLDSAINTVVRVRPREGLLPEVRRNGATWTLRLSPAAKPVSTDLLGVVQRQDSGTSRLFVPVIDTGERTIVYDPEVGDELMVVPLRGSGVGVARRQDYVDFRLLQTAQGLVIRPNVDDLSITPLRNGVAISGPIGLAVSSPEMRSNTSQRDAGRVRYKASLKRPILHFTNWRGGEEAIYDKRRQQLQRVLARAPRGGRNIARLELAKFYLAHGMAAEAAAFLQMVEAEDPGVVGDPTFKAMRGVASLMLHHLDDAERDLLHPKLKLYPDVALWRGALFTAQEKYEDASRQFALGAGFLPSFDASFQRRLAISWAVAAANGGSEADFLAAADRLAVLEPSPDIDGTLAYLQGRRAEALQQSSEAVGYYEAAINSHYRPMRAYAALRKTNLELEMGTLDTDTAVEQLESLRFAWRGDNFELSLLDRIVDLRVEKQEYGTALQLLRDTIATFPENEITKAMAQRLNTTFEELFLEGAADDLAPVTALALFYEFQELTPLGKKGDGMIQRLADRLVDVDLLDSAAELLEHQIAYRLEGAEKARVGARLSVIYLLDGQAEQALQTLLSTNVAVMPAEMERERRFLKARALSEVGKPDSALALLREDTDAESDQLRAEIFWRSERWQEAAETTERLLGASWRDEGDLGEKAQNQVIQMTVAYYMAGGGGNLERIREQYAQKMAAGPMADTFRVLTHHVDPASTEFRNLATEIARVADLESFMAGYRDRLKSGGLSALN